jgi:hypothetical protein
MLTSRARVPDCCLCAGGTHLHQQWMPCTGVPTRSSILLHRCVCPAAISLLRQVRCGADRRTLQAAIDGHAGCDEPDGHLRGMCG